jgi:TrmH family RNA methyltransferase
MISSTSNETIKLIRKLKMRKHRRETGQYYIEGLRIIGQALDSDEHFAFLITSPELLDREFGKQVLKTGLDRKIPVVEVTRHVFEVVSLKQNPQGLGAVLFQRNLSLDQVAVGKADLWVALDEVQDPGNLGTILRTMDAVGGRGMILLDHSTDPFDPTAIRASMGAIFSQQIVQTSFEEFRVWKKRTDTRVIGASGSARQDYHGFGYPASVVLLMGSERQGLEQKHYQICDDVVKIPMAGESDSLNLAVATAVILYEVFNQKRDRVKK